jgi:hypothetical protein
VHCNSRDFLPGSVPLKGIFKMLATFFSKVQSYNWVLGPYAASVRRSLYWYHLLERGEEGSFGFVLLSYDHSFWFQAEEAA